MSVHHRRMTAAPRPTSLDRATRTFEAVASTGADVARKGYLERLPVTREAVDPAGLIGKPVLNAHRAGGIEDILGRVTDARIDAGRLLARVEVAPGAAGDRVLDLVEGGFLTGTSLGYRVTQWSETRGPDGRLIRTATRWEPLELSLVAIPADAGATIRTEEHMTDDDTLQAEPAIRARADINREIRSIASVAGLTRDWADAQIDAETSVDDARAAAFDAMTRRPAPRHAVRASVTLDHDAPEARAQRIGAALHARAHPGTDPGEAARDFMGRSLTELARDCLTRAGVPTLGMGPDAVLTRSLHATSDFPLALGDAVGRSLRMGYEAGKSGIRNAARQTTAPDFRTRHRIQIGGVSTLAPVAEGAEVPRGTMAEARETYRLANFGRIFTLSRAMLLADDIGAFSDFTARLGAEAARFEAATLAALVAANPVMSDSVALFNATHGNLRSDGTQETLASFTATLTALKIAMQRQKGLSGEVIAATPRFVIVPPELEPNARAATAAITAARITDVNTNADLSVIVDPFLTDANDWYLAADPAQIDGLEYAYLEGAPGPQISQRAGFEVDGLEIKVSLDFGCGFVDWRSWAKNAQA